MGRPRGQDNQAQSQGGGGGKGRGARPKSESAIHSSQARKALGHKNDTENTKINGFDKSDVTSQDNSKQSWQCIYCHEPCENEEDVFDAIECSQCKRWAHQDCSGISKRGFETITGDDTCQDFEWTCRPCKVKRGKGIGTTHTDPRLDKLLEVVPCILSLDARMKNLEENLLGKKLEKKIEDVVEKVVDNRIAEALKEDKEIEMRKRNLIVVNLKESTKQDIEEACVDDLNEIQALFSQIVKIEEDDIEEYPKRLGNFEENFEEPRKVLVKLKCEKKKKEILMNSRIINEGVPLQDRIFINNDYTRKQRLEQKQLRDELKMRKDAGETNIGIRRGEIVTLPEKRLGTGSRGRFRFQNRRGFGGPPRHKLDYAGALTSKGNKDSALKSQEEGSGEETD